MPVQISSQEVSNGVITVATSSGIVWQATPEALQAYYNASTQETEEGKRYEALQYMLYTALQAFGDNASGYTIDAEVDWDTFQFTNLTISS